jgi:uncharacterized protein (TIGR02246 family)
MSSSWRGNWVRTNPAVPSSARQPTHLVGWRFSSSAIERLACVADREIEALDLMPHPRPAVFLALAMAAASASVQARSEVCHAASEKQIASLFDGWNAALQTGDPKKVVARYAAKSILLPTVSNKPRLSAEEKLDYFEHFVQRRPAGKIDSRTIEIDCNSAIDAGLYTFSFADGSQVNARYTFTYKWNGKRWLISSHHSSTMPEKS